MPVYNNEEVEIFELPGIKHQTVGGLKQGVESMEVWMQSIAPGASTPAHCHDCDEVIIILSGSGECTVAGETTKFGPNSTLIIKPDVVHDIVNTSSEEMKLVAALGMGPVRVKTDEGKPLAVPWEQS
ncbi:cupin domain-containing protein [Marinobacter sediminum]|uniref:cupin domain-containing protein n=1 Tax=Marinobacter sediminum TaxID=256323 RepID=UPI00202F1697|nr:cupin domain-containing protein [Marinobacter sediminum]MCM0612311.1 cupin domain-containing protein [Marinobacter sediminum]